METQPGGPVPLEVAKLGGLMQESPGERICMFTPPGNADLHLPDTQDYRDADLDGDGLICGLGFTAGLASIVAAPDDRKVKGSYGLAGRRWQ